MIQEFFKAKELSVLFEGEVTIGRYGIFVEKTENNMEALKNKRAYIEEHA